MSVKYKLVEKGNPSDPTAPKKYFALAKSSGNITLRQLSKSIATISTVSSIDTLAVLEGLLQVIPEKLLEGNIVRLGELGSFSLKLSSNGETDPTKFTSANITKTELKFRAGLEIRNVLDDAVFEKID